MKRDRSDIDAGIMRALGSLRLGSEPAEVIENFRELLAYSGLEIREVEGPVSASPGVREAILRQTIERRERMSKAAMKRSDLEEMGLHQRIANEARADLAKLQAKNP